MQLEPQSAEDLQQFIQTNGWFAVLQFRKEPHADVCQAGCFGQGQAAEFSAVSDRFSNILGGLNTNHLF